MPLDLLENTIEEPKDLLESVEAEKERDIPSFRQDKHTFWDDFKNFFAQDSEKEKAKAANAVTYAEMLNISPSTAYQYHDEISSQVKEKLADEKIYTEKKGLGTAVESAFDTSIAGMMGRQKVPEAFESVDQLERWVQGGLTMALDLPVFIAGMALGGGPTTPSGWAGSFALPAGLRQVLVDKYSKGEAKTFGEFMDRAGNAVRETIKGEVVGYLTGVAGAATPIGYKALSELATMTAAGKFIEGQIPTARELIDNAAVLLIMHAGITGVESGKLQLAEIKSKIKESFVKDGVHPKRIVEEVSNKSTQELKGDLADIIGDAIAEIKETLQKPGLLARKTSQETPPSVASAETRKTSGQVSVDATESTSGEATSLNAPTRDFSRKTTPTMPEEGATGIKNAIVDLERAKRGEGELETPVKARPENWREIIKEKVDAGEIDPNEMARRISNSIENGEKIAPEMMTDVANVAFTYGKKKLQNEHSALEAQIEKAGEEGKSTIELERRRDEIEVEIDLNEKATKAIGTEQGRSLQSRQEMIAEDYSFSAMIQRAKADGIVLTPQVRTRLKNLSKKIEKAQKKLNDLDNIKSTDNLKKSIEILKNEEGLKQRKEKRAAKKEEIDLEFDDIVKKLNKQLSNQFNVGLDPVAVKLMVDLARNRIKKGIVTAEGIVDEIYVALKNTGIEFSKRDIRDAISGYGVVKSMSKEEVAVALREAKRQMQLLSALEDAKAGEAPLRSGLQRDKPSDRVRELQREVKQAMRESGIDVAAIKTPEQQWATSIESVKTRLRNQIVDLAKQLETGEKRPKPEGIKYDERAEELKRLRDKIQETLEFVDGGKDKKPLSAEQRLNMAMKSTEKSIIEYERRIDAADLSAKKKGETVSSPELDALRKDRDLLKYVYKIMKDEAKPKATPEEIARKSFKTRTENNIAELERRLKEKDFSDKPKKDPVKLGEKELELKFELDKAKKEYARQRIEYQNQMRGTGKKITDGMVEAINFSRALKTSLDLSAVLRQGAKIVLGHPIRGAKVIPDMWKALRSEAGQFEVDQKILKDPNYALGQKSKLYLSEQGENLTKMEEVYMSHWSEKVPLVAASQRAYTTFLNKLRMDSFSTMIDALSAKKGKPTKEEAEAIANYINVATGRGNPGLKENVLVGFNTVFFAPRYVLSRFQLLAGQPMYKGTAATRIAIAKEYGRFLTGLAVVYGIGLASGATVETDPRSSDFGKIRFGNTRIDPLAGLSQTSVLLSRVVSGKTKKMSGVVTPIRGDYVPYGSMNTADVLANFLRSKLSPVFGTGVDIVAGKDIVGEKTTMFSVPEKLLMPLALSDIYSVMVEQGVPMGTALGTLSIFGMGLQTYEPRGY